MANDAYKRTPFGQAQTVEDRLADLESRFALFPTPPPIPPIPAFEPVGVMKMWLWGAVPNGYLLLDGQVVLRADWPDLFTLWGTTFNTGGESGLQFRVPDWKGRVPVGLDAAQAEFDTLNEAGGAKTHTLGYNELPNEEGVRVMWGAGGGNVHFDSNGLQVYAVGGASTGNGLYTNQNDPAWDQTGTTQGAPHNNLQPYRVVHFIVKASAS